MNELIEIVIGVYGCVIAGLLVTDLIVRNKRRRKWEEVGKRLDMLK